MIMINDVKSTPINYCNTKSKKIYSLNIQIFFIVYTIYINQINHQNFSLFYLFILQRSNSFTQYIFLYGSLSDIIEMKW